MSTDEQLEEIADIALEAVCNDISGELPGVLVGKERYARLVELLIEIEKLPESWRIELDY